MLKDGDDLSWYARKAARPGLEDIQGPEPRRSKRRENLLLRLQAAGIKGDLRSVTLFTRRLPPGCRQCLMGLGTNLYVTGLCTRDCFFCFNQKPRRDEIAVHGLPVREPEEAAEIVRRYGLKSIGISGGEPLLFPERVLRILRALRELPGRLRIDLYTNGDRADESLLRELRAAGLDALRLNLAARGYDTSPLGPALRVFDEVAVEVPVIPGEMPSLKEMVLKLDRLGVPFLNIHELFLCVENKERVLAEGHELKAGEPFRHLLWRPTAESGEAALELLLFALESTSRLSVYYCSCGTQEIISRRGYLRRRRGSPEAASDAEE